MAKYFFRLAEVAFRFQAMLRRNGINSDLGNEPKGSWVRVCNAANVDKADCLYATFLSNGGNEIYNCPL